MVEVLSVGAAYTDRILKMDEYRRTPSIQHYLLLEQEQASGTLFTRHGDFWDAAIVGMPGDVILPAVDVTLPVAEVYRDLIPQG